MPAPFSKLVVLDLAVTHWHFSVICNFRWRVLCSIYVLQEAWSTGLPYSAVVLRSYRNGLRTFSLFPKVAARQAQSQRSTCKHTQYKLITIAKMKPATCWCVKNSRWQRLDLDFSDAVIFKNTISCSPWKASHWVWLVPPLTSLIWAASAPSVVDPWSHQRSVNPGLWAACAPHRPSNPLLHWDIKR